MYRVIYLCFVAATAGAEPCGQPFGYGGRYNHRYISLASLSLSWQSFSAAVLTCGSDFPCTTATDTVLPDVVCATGECTDAECCEAGEPLFFVFCFLGASLSKTLNNKMRDRSFDWRVNVADRVLVLLC